MESEADCSSGPRKQKLHTFNERTHPKKKHSNIEKFLKSRAAWVIVECPGIQ
jgi:hypothetical protein